MKHVLTASFDPVSQAELEYLKRYRRENGIRDLYVCVSEEGILPADIRKKLLFRALKPYRHIHVTDSGEGAEIIEETDEEKIRGGIYRLAAAGIRKELAEKGYYFPETVKHMCNPHRAVHSRNVAEVCVSLAAVHGMDEKKAWMMGMLHDITKAFSDEENRRIIAVWKPEWLSLSPKIWHSFTAAQWLAQNMCISDSAVRNALEHHTVGDGRSAWAHLLYIADKIEPARGYDTSRETALAKKNLKQAAELIREESRAYILEKEGIHV